MARRPVRNAALLSHARVHAADDGSYQRLAVGVWRETIFGGSIVAPVRDADVVALNEFRRDVVLLAIDWPERVDPVVVNEAPTAIDDTNWGQAGMVADGEGVPDMVQATGNVLNDIPHPGVDKDGEGGDDGLADNADSDPEGDPLTEDWRPPSWRPLKQSNAYRSNSIVRFNMPRAACNTLRLAS